MSYVEIFIIGLGLSMDAAAVSMTDSMVYNKDKKLKAMPVFFGGFQAIMPLLGFYAAGTFSKYVEKYAGIVAFVILALIGGNMIREALTKKEEKSASVLTYRLLFFQAVATAVDAFAVGVTFSVMGAKFGANIFLSVLLIGLTTAVCSTVSVFIGKKFGEFLEGKAEIFGGIILIIIGIKSLLGL